MSGSALQRGLGAYLGLAVGDALGATVEFMTPREIQADHGVHRRIIGGGWLHLKPGTVTDDTTMSLALGRAILASDTLDGVAMAEAFSQWMRDRPVDIGHTVRRGIIRYRRTGEIETPLNDNDAGNGACMRVLPVVLATLDQPLDALNEACYLQGRITHHHPLSDAGTVCVATMVRMAIQGCGPADLIQGPVEALVTAHPEFRFRGKREENPSGFIVHTLRAVFQALFDTDNFEDCLVDVVNRGGDADTTGAIAGMIAGALYGEASIPHPWRSALDGRVAEAVTTQARALMAGDCLPA
ncbi:ADP-ribosyl-[dinitrogen reductase] hydrolase [Ectothiorhodospira lacustris]|uniref:ADP-ribosyl-[dinitrogen reductase] hydrolase n=1 Tax=Ectothiorhodospira lacustris TaxID=2899127 RepID=UPI001EE7D141|nr:ADP-ribosyl-[dinitrogen reductase] hydrolase [Ectothiorhodospira lacustris]MCG5510481.1 ADP-ribosyl-[dinitrogen reductase] hydrolase [Ectothiorhodospira lacustris]MCG5522227.1 ADP-ribosyl-[dinitrogen reductase] hydrolase [Ectothiorhodospira lacustris]